MPDEERHDRNVIDHDCQKWELNLERMILCMCPIVHDDTIASQDLPDRILIYGKIAKGATECISR
jgi:hypothetical protein